MRHFLCCLFLFKSFLLADSKLLNKLLNFPEFRYVKVKSRPCSDQRKCTTTSCSVSKYVKNGFIDVLGIKETNTDYSGSSQQVWSEIYSKTNSKEMTSFISGIHFSVSVHISRNYFQFFMWHLPNPNVYHKRFKKEYKDNFLNLLKTVESSILSLNNDNIIFISKNIDKKGEKMSHRLRFFVLYNLFIKKIKKQIQNERENNSNDKTFRSNDEANRSNQRECSPNDTNNNSIPSINKNRYKSMNFNEILKIIDCVDCDKCKILGNLQFEGLKQALRILKGRKISTNDLIYLLAFYKKIAQTKEDILYLENLVESWVYELVNYANVIGYLAMILIFIKVIFLYQKQK
ncbi:ERO1-like protein beta [Nosema bombycis CQ1]|uniref:ERO1-like protein beta n=1 Tax=Nosema bombycis (strain CQ1 / CVCC 102059) TaxID=578461 RepID=R0KPG0_NOSB1|nr:ERO1-like protein beta [Nosema bombycis CQ1]|eukprot:EOB12591.1 ERO1-like protein beta [Nosema bombycis CQ1]